MRLISVIKVSIATALKRTFPVIALVASAPTPDFYQRLSDSAVE